jgi:hypothetical protein
VDEMGSACMKQMINTYNISVRKQETDHVKEVGVERTITIE